MSEADTVTLVKDVLADVFGYDKYAELTSEHAIRGTFCDLAIKVENKLRLLVEVKAIGTKLSEKHLKQAVDYAANEGVDYVLLTNAAQWMMYHVLFTKPIDAQPVVEFDLLQLDGKSEPDLERLYLLTREGLLRGALTEFRERRDATSRYILAAILTASEPVLSALRREVRRVTGVLVESDAIARVLRDEVVKRECVEGDPATEALRKVERSADRAIVDKEPSRAEAPAAEGGSGESESRPASPPPPSVQS